MRALPARCGLIPVQLEHYQPVSTVIAVFLQAMSYEFGTEVHVHDNNRCVLAASCWGRSASEPRPLVDAGNGTGAHGPPPHSNSAGQLYHSSKNSSEGGTDVISTLMGRDAHEGGETGGSRKGGDGARGGKGKKSQKKKSKEAEDRELPV